MERRIDAEDGVGIHGPAPDQPLDVMQLLGTNGTSLTLLIVASDTDLRRAGQRTRQSLA
ncbi:hypothetical protein [Nocardia rhamnosiphila]|uniref:Uncharacterized protein n=1 Tax=Nocardia rhamnosiphila TaxID=426716 RepID=A0ABV2X121_9NOCA